MTETSINEYATKMENIEKMIIDLLDCKISTQNLINFINDHNIAKNNQDFRIFLHLISEISANYNRSRRSFDRIEPLLKHYLSDIKNQFQNFDIFNIFKDNKLILLLLFKEKILIPCKSIFNVITNMYYNSKYYLQFFYPEFKSFYTPEFIKEFDKKSQNSLLFKLENLKIDEEKREIGENDSEPKLLQIIRNDDVNSLNSYFSKKKSYDENSTIFRSLYESYLPNLGQISSIIEYATFCGSINIFNFLKSKNVELKPNLWIYAARSNNLEMIQLLEKCNVQIEKDSIENIFNESVICHHNQIAKYLMDKYEIFGNMDVCLKSYNFTIMVNLIQAKRINWNDNALLYYCCKYDYYNFVEILIKNQKLNANEMIISKKFFLYTVLNLIC